MQPWGRRMPDMTPAGPAPSLPMECGEGLEGVKLIEDPTALPHSRESLKMRLAPVWAQQASFLIQSVLCFGIGGPEFFYCI